LIAISILKEVSPKPPLVDVSIGSQAAIKNARLET